MAPDASPFDSHAAPADAPEAHAPEAATTPPLAIETPGEAASAPESAAEARRLHPMTLFQRVLVSLPGMAFLLLPFLLRSPDENAWFSLGSAVLYGLVALPLIVLQYLRFSYWITPREIVIQSGVLNRQHRSIPIERVQNIQIVQPLVPRLFGTAKVKVETAGSSATEGVLEYVGLEEARRIRQVVRSFQQQQQADAETPASVVREEDPGAASQAKDVPAEAASAQEEEIFAMPLGRVLLSGVFRFSLFYIALIFSVFQYVPDFEERLTGWIERGAFQGVADLVMASPVLAAFFTIGVAALFAWLTGIAVNLNRFYNFRLAREGDKLHRRQGLLTLSEGTIPIRKVQALVVRTNPLMRLFGLYALDLQTMGLDVEKQGHQTAVPIGRLEEIEALARHIRPFEMPEAFHPVSRLTIRRAFVRYAVALMVAVALVGGVGALFGDAGYFWRPALWGFAGVPLLLGFAYLRYRYHGYALSEDALYVRGGVVRHYVWVLPTEKHQVFHAQASFFQRRLGLKSLYVDTAGAATFAYPEVMDLPAAEADRRLSQLYVRFQRFFA